LSLKQALKEETKIDNVELPSSERVSYFVVGSEGNVRMLILIDQGLNTNLGLSHGMNVTKRLLLETQFFDSAQLQKTTNASSDSEWCE
jgi:hypothetical protein